MYSNEWVLQGLFCVPCLQGVVIFQYKAVFWKKKKKKLPKREQVSVLFWYL